MTAAITPGPWADAYEDEIDGLPVLVIETDQPTGPNLRTICHVQPTFLDDSDTFAIEQEDRANAKAITAVPAMIEALKYVAQMNRERCETASADMLFAMLDLKVDRAVKALKQAGIEL